MIKKQRSIILFCISVGVILLHASFLNSPKLSYSKQNLESYLSGQTDVFKSKLIDFLKLAENKRISKNKLVQQFLQCRLQYKKIEFFTGYYFAYSERDINGPALPEIEEEKDSKYERPPHGLQVIEQILFEDSLDHSLLINELKLLIKLSNSLSYSFKTLGPYEYQLFDVLQMRLVKLYALGVNNFDCQFTKTGIPETEASLREMKTILTHVYGVNAPEAFVSFYKKIDLACAYLSANKKSAHFNFFDFYRLHIFPLNKELIALRSTVVKANPQRIQALNLSTSSLFETDAYNTHYFTKLQKANSNTSLIKLGQTLFFDPLLSKNNAVSCASCHKPELAFTDGKTKAAGLLMGDTLPRNTPTLLNAALQKNLFMDARALVLEDQARDVVQNEREMHGDFEEVASKLRQSADYRKMFKDAFKNSKDSSIAEHGILTALAEFQRTLLSLNSRFDKSIRGEQNALTDDEVAGYNLFMGKAKCGHCHFTGLFNGTMPPLYDESEFDIIGVPSTHKPPYHLDADEGRYSVFKTPALRYAFKTTTVRNAGVTAPYMHNGVFNTLEEVVDFYNKGGGAGIGVSIPEQTLPAEKLNLTPKEQQQLVLFIQSLTDTSAVTQAPSQLPAMDDPSSELNKRKTGGSY